MINIAMHGTASLISQIQFEAAVDRAIDDPPKLLPPSSVYPALNARRADLATWAYQATSGDWLPASESVVPVSKGRHGIRPVGVWDLKSRLTYSALVESLNPHVPAPIRNGPTWQAFLEKPLSEPGEYVVAADIAACYQFLDHAILSQELLVQSGMTREVDQICMLLREVSGRSYGLPQQSRPSDALAEVYLDRLERAVIRRGVEVSRYNDDFRFNSDSWSKVVRGLEILAEEAREVGLTLNDAKVITWKKSKYRARLEEAKRLRDEIAEEAELDLTKLELDYEGDVIQIEPEDAEVELEAAVRVLERWKRIAGKGTVADGKRAEHRALVELVPVALRALATDSNDSPNVLDILMAMLRFEQAMTPHVGSFLMTRTDEAAVLKSFDKALRADAYLTGWQTWWLQQPLGRLSDLTKGRGSTKRKTWLHAAFTTADRSPMLRAEASLTLARHKLISKEELLSIYDRSSDVERPTVVAALGLLKPGNTFRRAVVGDSKVYEWIFDWAVGLA